MSAGAARRRAIFFSHSLGAYRDGVSVSRRETLPLAQRRRGGGLFSLDATHTRTHALRVCSRRSRDGSAADADAQFDAVYGDVTTVCSLSAFNSYFILEASRILLFRSVPFRFVLVWYGRFCSVLFCSVLICSNLF